MNLYSVFAEDAKNLKLIEQEAVKFVPAKILFG